MGIGKIIGKVACFGGIGEAAPGARQAKGKAPERATKAHLNGRAVAPRSEATPAGRALDRAMPNPTNTPLVARGVQSATGPVEASSSTGARLDLKAPDRVTPVAARASDEVPITIDSHGKLPTQSVVCRTRTEADDRARTSERPEEFVRIGAAQQSRTALHSDSFGPCVPVIARFPDGVNALHHAFSVDAERAGRMTGRHGGEDPLDTRPWLTTAQPTDVFVVCRNDRMPNARAKQDGVLQEVATQIQPGTSLHVVNVPHGGSLSVSVNQSELEIWAIEDRK